MSKATAAIRSGVRSDQLLAHDTDAASKGSRAARASAPSTGTVARLQAVAACTFVLAAGALTAAGCGSDSSGGGSSPTTSGGATEKPAAAGGTKSQSEAKAAVAKYTAAQPAVKVEPLGEAPAKGKKIAVMTCAPAACVSSIGGAEEAAKALGWSTQSFTNPFTPEGYQAAWDQIVQARPDGVVYIGVLPNELIKSQLAQLKKMNVPLMGISPAANSLTPGSPIQGVFANEPNFGLSGSLMANIVLADHKGAPGKAVLLFDKVQEANLGIVKTNFKGLMGKAGWDVDVLAVSNTQEGKGIPGQVVSYLQRNPKVEYVAIQASEYSTGVPEAVKAAGLPQPVKIIGRVPDAANVKQIRNGTMFAAVAEEAKTAGTRSVDALVRLFAGKHNFDPEPVGWHQIITKETVDNFKLDSLGSPAVPGDPEAFHQAWGLAK